TSDTLAEADVDLDSSVSSFTTTSEPVCCTTRYTSFGAGCFPVAGSTQKELRAPFQVPRMLRGTPGIRWMRESRHNQKSHKLKTTVLARTAMEKNLSAARSGRPSCTHVPTTKTTATTATMTRMVIVFFMRRTPGSSKPPWQSHARLHESTLERYGRGTYTRLPQANAQTRQLARARDRKSV